MFPFNLILYLSLFSAFIYALIRHRNALGRILLLFGGNTFFAILLGAIKEAINGNYENALQLLNPLNSLIYYDQQIVNGDFWLGFVGTLAWILLFSSVYYESIKVYSIDLKKERKYMIPISIALGSLTVYAFGGLRETVQAYNNIIVITAVIIISLIIGYIIFMIYERVLRNARRNKSESSNSDRDRSSSVRSRTSYIRISELYKD